MKAWTASREVNSTRHSPSRISARREEPSADWMNQTMWSKIVAGSDFVPGI
jgi:hypothetical protein